jgi:hypothetical protein
MSRVNRLTSPPAQELLQAAEEEVTRCLRLLVGCLSNVSLFDHLPKVRVVDAYPALPEQPFQVEKTHEITLHTTGDGTPLVRRALPQSRPGTPPRRAALALFQQPGRERLPGP